MDPENTVGFTVKTITNLITRRVHENSPSVTRMQNWIMGYLYRSQKEAREVYQRDIEHVFDIRRSTATGILQGLEKNGWIRKEAVASDARLKRLVLTEEAERMQERNIREMACLEELVRRGISEEETQCFIATAKKMIANLKAAESERACQEEK